ncbi:MAG: nucleotidyltransferase domain-containing protein [Chloroflexi bacterium]|nr:nucleotidyltransferase domain-containing protein [Chloroflexota bacterium]
MSSVFEIADRLVRHAERRFPGQVALIVCYGSHMKGTATATSDLDIYYIPVPPAAAQNAAQKLCTQFVFDGLPYDLWPVRWSMLEDIARAEGERPWGLAASLLADARVIYARSDLERSRFHSLQMQLRETMQAPARGAMIERAGRALDKALTALGRMHMLAATDLAVEHDHTSAAHAFLQQIADALALLNQRAYSKNWGANHEEIMRMPLRPRGLDERFEKILHAANSVEVLQNAAMLAVEMRALIAANLPAYAQRVPPSEVLRDFYFVVLEYANKIGKACARNDRRAAEAAAVILHNETARTMARIEPGLEAGSALLYHEFAAGFIAARIPDLLHVAREGDLNALARAAARFDAGMLRYLQTHGVASNIFTDERDLQNFLDARAR